MSSPGNFEQTEAQLVTPVRLALGEVELFEQRLDRRFFRLRPFDIAPERREAAAHVTLIGFALAHRADRGESLQPILLADTVLGE